MQTERRARIHKLRLEEGAKKAAEELEKCMKCLSFLFSEYLRAIFYDKKWNKFLFFSAEQMILAATQMLPEIHTRHSLLQDL